MKILLSFLFLLALSQNASASHPYPIISTYVDSCAFGCDNPAFTAGNITADDDSVWSSQYHSSPNAFAIVAAWFTSTFEGRKRLNNLSLVARINYPFQVVCFPKYIDVYISDGTRWIYDQSIMDSHYFLNLDALYVNIRQKDILATGVMLIGSGLTADIYGGYYFQLDSLHIMGNE